MLSLLFSLSCSRVAEVSNHLAIILVGCVLLWDRVRGRADGRAALDVPVVAIDDDFGGIAD
jgi:hypothetical protein